MKVYVVSDISGEIDSIYESQSDADARVAELASVANTNNTWASYEKKVIPRQPFTCGCGQVHRILDNGDRKTLAEALRERLREDREHA